MAEKPNWYNKLSRTKRKRVILANKRKRQKMTDSERQLMRAKWRLAKQRQRQLRAREGPGHTTW